MKYTNYKGHKISKRKDGRYGTKYTENGQQKSVYGKTQKECYLNLKAKIDSLKPKSKEPTKLHPYIDFWIDTYKKATQNETTLKKTKQTINNHIKPNLPNKAIKDYTTSEINTF